MNDFVIKVSKLNRSVTSCESFIGLDGENLVENLIFIFTDTFVNGNARLEYIVNDEKYFIELNKGNNYYSIPIKNVITKEGNIEMQLVISKPSENNEIIVFKSDIFTVYCKKSINAVEEAPDGYVVWLDHANEILRQMENLNIIAYKENGITYIVVTSKEGVSTTYQIKDGKNGRNGIDGEKGEDGNGIIKIEKTGTVNNVDTYTIYYTNGTTSTFTVTNSTVTDEEFEALQQEVDKYKTLANILPRVNGTGTELSLENTGEGTPLEIDLEGQTSQESTTGKNILPNNGTSQTLNGVTFTKNQDGSIKVNGTATADTVYYLNTTNITISAGTYIFNGCPSNGSWGTYSMGFGSYNDSGSGATLTLAEPYSNRAYIRIANGFNANNLLFKPMISVNGGDYEPYTGGIPAPNPDYTYPIKKVSGDNNVKIENKNFFKDKYKNGVADLFVGSDLTNTEINLDLDSAVGKTIVTLGCYLKAGTYTLSNVSSTYISFNRIAIAGTTCVGSSIHLRNSYTWTQNVDGYTYFGIEGDAGETSYTDTPIASELKLQIENGSTATTYEEHEEQNFPLTLGAKNLLNANPNSYTFQPNQTYYQTLSSDKVYLEAGTKYYISYTINNVTTGNVRSTPRLYLDASNVYYNATTNRNLTTGRKVDEYTPSTSGEYQVQYWLQGSNEAVTISDFMISTSKSITYYPYGEEPLEVYEDGEFIKTTGKNLFDYNTCSNTGIVDDSGTIATYNTRLFSDKIKVTPNDTYTFKTTAYSTNNERIYINRLVFYNSDGEFLRRNADYNTLSEATFTIPNDVYYIVIDLRTQALTTNLNKSILKDNTQLEFGSTATSYEPYGTGEWYLKSNMGKHIITNTDITTISNYWYSSKGVYGAGILKSLLGLSSSTADKTSYCTVSRKAINLASVAENTYSFWGNASTIFFFSSEFDTIEHANAKLVGATMIYQKDTPSFTKITSQTLIEQLENLKINAKSYKDVTNISQTNDELPFIITTSGFKDLSNL